MSKAKKIVLVFLSILTISTLFLAVPVSASTGTVYTMAHHQPESSNYDGYLEVLYKSTSGSKYDVYTYFWTIGNLTTKTTEDVIFPRMSIHVSKTSLNYSYGFYSTNQTDKTRYQLMTGFMRSSDGYYDTYLSGTLGDGIPYLNSSISIPSGYEIVGVKIYGNGIFGTNSIAPSNGGSWTVVYGGDNAILRQLEQIKEALQQQNSNNQAITNNADKNASNIQNNANKNASEIQDNADKNASDIQNNADKNANDIQNNADKNANNIINNQNQIVENERNETETQGKDSIDDVSGSIEDKSSGFVSSIQNLVSAMSYNGTACAWKFPSIKLPAIAGVMEERKLTDEMPIDFGYWVNKIPSNILLLVRSVLTIALIGFCFKELYSTISYVLTLKGGGSDE